MVKRLHRLPVCLVDGAAFVFGRTIKTIEFEVLCLGAVDHVMPGSSWDDDRKSVGYSMSLPIQYNRSLPSFEPDELIQRVHFSADFFTRLQIHQHQLTMFGGEENLAIILIFTRGVFILIDVTIHRLPPI
jgi:hypothetical protein